MEMRAFIINDAAGCWGIGLIPLDEGGMEEQMGLAVYREPLLRGEWKVDFVDSRTRLGNAQTSLALHSLLPRFCGCAWNGGWC